MPTAIKLLINPLKIDEFNSQHQEALHSFLHEGNAAKKWGNYTEYEYTYNSIIYQFNFTQALLRVKKKTGLEGERFEVYDPLQLPLGKGGYGVVYPITGTIKFTTGKAQVKSGDRKVVKIQDHSRKNRTHEVKIEYQGLRQSGYLHPKPPIFITDDGHQTSYLIMDKAQGVPLENILNPQKSPNDKRELTILKRVELTLALLTAVKMQVENKLLIHRDIKPGNLIVDLEQSPPKVTVIDFGFNLDAGQQDYHKVGTRAYRAPESFVIFPRYSTKSDVYSLGRVLSYLWGDNFRNYYIGKDKDLDYIKTKSTNVDLFNIPEIKFLLTRKDQNSIRSHLNQMLSIDPNLRPTLDESISFFSQINLHYYQNLEYLNTPCVSREQLGKHWIVMNKYLLKLREKEINLKARGHIEAANKVRHLAKELQINTSLLMCKNSSTLLKGYKIACIGEIDSAKSILQCHRDVWWLIAEVLTAIALLGVGYLIALGVNYAYTGRVGLFSQTKSEKLVDEVKETILSWPPEPTC